jgi:hypothetical protein
MRCASGGKVFELVREVGRVAREETEAVMDEKSQGLLGAYWFHLEMARKLGEAIQRKDQEAITQFRVWAMDAEAKVWSALDEMAMGARHG